MENNEKQHNKEQKPKKQDSGKTELTDSLLLKISLAFALLGVVVLFFISSSIDVNETSISKITAEDTGNSVIVTGRITKIIEGDNVQIMNIEKKETVPVVLFNKENVLASLSEGNVVQVCGSIEEYNGKPEIIGDEVRLLN